MKDVKIECEVKEPHVAFNKDDVTCVLLENYSVNLTLRGVPHRVTIGKGFVYDGASIPRFFWRVVGHPYQGRTLPGATVHDALYASELMARSDADSVFYAMMKATKTGRVKRLLFWLIVRFFGGSVWSHHTARSREKARKFVKVEFGGC